MIQQQGKIAKNIKDDCASSESLYRLRLALPARSAFTPRAGMLLDPLR